MTFFVRKKQRARVLGSERVRYIDTAFPGHSPQKYVQERAAPSHAQPERASRYIPVCTDCTDGVRTRARGGRTGNSLSASGIRWDIGIHWLLMHIRSHHDTTVTEHTVHMHGDMKIIGTRPKRSGR